MTNHQIGVALQKIATLLGSFATQLMQKPSASLPQSQPKAVAKVLTFPKGTKPVAVTKAKPLSDRHATIVAKFRKAGIKDPQLFTDIKTVGLWLADGFRPRKGTKSIHGLFHRSQVQPVG